MYLDDTLTHHELADANTEIRDIRNPRGWRKWSTMAILNFINKRHDADQNLIDRMWDEVDTRDQESVTMQAEYDQRWPNVPTPWWMMP